METSLIGEYIKKRREDLGLTQEQLSEGICTAATLSRLENNLQTPTRDRISALLQRLGLPGDRYFALLSKNEEEIASLRKSIQADVICFERSAEENRSLIRDQALEKLAELEKITESDDLLTRQYILSSKAILGKQDGPYNLEEQLSLLMEAIRLTVPRFDAKRIELGRYTLAETTIMNQIARTYSSMGQKKTAIDIYCQLLEYIGKNDKELPKYAGHFCLVAYNYAIDLGHEKFYSSCMEIAEQGKRACMKYGDYQFLPGFLAILAECCYFMDQKERSAHFYTQAYYVYESIGNESDKKIIEEEMRSRLGLRLPCYSV